MTADDERRRTAEAGRRLRRDVLGPEYLEPLLAGSNAFDRPYHAFVEEVLWGRVWGESRLSVETKLRLNLAIFTVLGRPEDLAPYVRSAARHGIDFDEIREIITLAAMYAGLPNGFAAIYAAYQRGLPNRQEL